MFLKIFVYFFLTFSAILPTLIWAIIVHINRNESSFYSGTLNYMGQIQKFLKISKFLFAEIFFWLKQMCFLPFFTPLLVDFHHFLLYEAFQTSADHLLQPAFINNLLILEMEFLILICPLSMVTLPGFLNLTHVTQATIVLWWLLPLCYNCSMLTL